MRLFVGTFLNARNQLYYDRLVRDVVKHHGETLRGIPAGSAHLTYTFCANTGSHSVEEIHAALDRIVTVRRLIDVRLSTAHVIEVRHRPRLVCADIVRGDQELRSLTAAITDGLQAAIPDLSWSASRAPHITLARFSDRAKRSDSSRVNDWIAARAGKGAVRDDRIDQVAVISSKLTPRGPEYTIERYVKLRN